MDAILEARGLSLSYGRRILWEDVSLRLMPGEVAQLWGANGSGKTSLLRCLALWQRASEGSIVLLGKDVTRGAVGCPSPLFFVCDTPSFYDDLTAREHIQFLLRANGLHEREKSALKLMDRFGLSAHLDVYPSSFSRGMRYKLAVVLALSLRPSLLLLDEPYGPLDPQAALLLGGLLGELASEGSAILLSCHQEPRGLVSTQRLELGRSGLLRGGEGESRGRL